ncbi:MAG: tRNA (adenosine(37)-N6)-threonylcarbamoyltransferase complex transferase subunit TsaD [Flavobacteriaceae bacterium]|nr:tRNA (adenosine(37)-N6)-threonylcarbamoyltransferase complex transferase subunit TsaD [Flavobacteriaceae bacterium]
MSQKPCYILGIESSCDETSAAILKNNIVLSNIIANQKVHKEYGGVVPELASREHQKNIIPVVEMALNKAKIKKNTLSAIAYTRGPGLLGSLLVGSSFAKSFSMGLKIPLIEVNHMQAHILCHFIGNELKPKFPFIGVTLSGGHTQIILVKNYFEMKIIGSTIDDAIGEAFDKCGKMLGLEYPSGPKIDELSKKGNPNCFKFPIPKVDGYNVSYSGFKTSVLNFLNKKNKKFINQNLHDLCASIQNTLIKIIIEKVKLSINDTKNNTIAIGGGVSANSSLRDELKKLSKKHKWNVFFPKLEYTTDNAAMIGIVGFLKYKNGKFSSINSKCEPKLKI